MNSPEAPFFSKSMMRLVKASLYKDDMCTQLVSTINKIRLNYTWSQKQYNKSNLSDVYVITDRKNIFGFIECYYNELDITSSCPISISLEELHVASSMQGKGVGAAVLEHLLGKVVSVQMVVANENERMLSLVNKFNPEHKYITTNTRTVIIKAKQPCAIA